MEGRRKRGERMWKEGIKRDGKERIKKGGDM